MSRDKHLAPPPKPPTHVLEEALNIAFESSVVDAVIVAKDPATGRVNCTLFSPNGGLGPFRHARAGTPSEAITKVLATVPRRNAENAVSRALRAPKERDEEDIA